MDIRHLRYFLAIAENGSFARAARILNVAQPALSAHVRKMEAQLGTALLFRSAQGVIPTEAGQTMIRNARLILDQVAAAEAEIRGYAANVSGTVRLGIPGTISQKLTVPLILAARRQYPDITLRIAEAMSGYVLDWLRDDHIDLAVLYSPAAGKDLASRMILFERLCMLGPAGSTGLASPAAASIDFRDLAALPLILPGAAHGLRKMLEQHAGAQGVAFQVKIEVDSYAAIKDLVEHGLGFSILPMHAISAETASGRLKSWSIVNPAVRREVHLIKPADKPVTRAVTAIEALCVDLVGKMVTDGAWEGVTLAQGG